MTLASLTDGPRAYLILATLALALYLPGINSLPVTDRDEARFAQATRQMVESGDFVNIRFQKSPRNKKPAGIHWLQAASVHGLNGGDTSEIWAYRVPSVLGALGAVLALFALARPVFGRESAFLGAAMLAGALLTNVEAHIAKTDAMLLFCVVIAQGALMGIYRHGREGAKAPVALAMAFWAAIGAGILVKGPVLPLIAIFTVTALAIADRRAGFTARLWARLRPVAGLILATVIAAPWFVAMALGDSGFISGALTGDLLPKLLGGQESHGALPGYYLALAPFTLWPAVLLVPFGLIWAWRNRRDPAPRFCLAWLIPAWLALELVPTKLPHYVLPLYPAAALMAAGAAIKGREALEAAMGRWPGRVWLALWCLAGLALAAVAPAISILSGGNMTAMVWAPAPAAALVVAIGIIAFIKRDTLLAAAGPAPLMILFMGLIFAAALPNMGQLWPSAAARALVSAHRTTNSGPIAAAGYHEPSLVFALGTATVLARTSAAARHVAEKPSALALIERRRGARFRAALAKLGFRAVALGTVRGFNTAKGRSVTLILYRAEMKKP